MKDYEVMVEWFENYEICISVILGWETCLFHISIYIYILHSSPYLCVYGDDRITCYPGADDLRGEPEDA